MKRHTPVIPFRALLGFVFACALPMGRADDSVPGDASPVGRWETVDFVRQIDQFQKMAQAGMTTTPEELGNVACFLCSDVSRKINGQCLRVSGLM